MHRSMIVPLLLTLWVTPACTGAIHPVQGSGQAATEQRPVHNFQQIILRLPADVTLKQGNQERLVIKADDNLLPMIRTEVNHGQLIIQSQPGALSTSQPIKLLITLKHLNRLELSGSSTVELSKLQTERLTVESSGATKLSIYQLEAQELDVTATGTSEARLAGRVKTQSIDLSGTGTYQAAKLECDRAITQITGAGEATLWVKQQLDVDLAGVGSVRYYGNPQVNPDISGAGSVKPLGITPP